MLYLASSSPRRTRLLKEAGIQHRIIKTDFKEKHFAGQAPARAVQKNALGKGLAALRRIQSGRILAADTIVYFGGKIIGKPRNRREAEKTLFSLQGNWHMVYTGVSFLDIKNGKIKKKLLFYEKTKVKLKKMGLSEIRRYFRRVHPMDKAGAYAIQNSANSVVEAVQGSFSNAVGLPMEKLKKNLDMLECPVGGKGRNDQKTSPGSSKEI